MSRVEFRTYRAGERDVLRSLASRTADWGSDVTGAGCLFAACLLVGMLCIRWLHLPRTPWQGIAALVSAATAVAAVAYMRRRGTGRLHRGPYAADLARGQAEVTTYDIVEAIRVEEGEDEGSQYYVKLEDGSVCFLAGQYLYEVEGERKFPSTRVIVTRAPVSRMVLDVQCSGDYLPPSATRPPFSDAELRGEAVPQDGDELAVDFETLR